MLVYTALRDRAWEFRDFVSERGENVIHSWLHGRSFPVAARAEINDLIQLLERRDVGRFTRADGVGDLRRECRGLIELRVKVGGVQYRPLGYYGPGDRIVTLLAGATERDRQLTPVDVCATAIARITWVKENAGRYSREHDLT